MKTCLKTLSDEDLDLDAAEEEEVLAWGEAEVAEAADQDYKTVSEADSNLTRKSLAFENAKYFTNN